jgi:Cdc6-like AAA superfamily ATPase
MAELLSNRVLSALRGVDGLYHRLVLLVGKRGSGKTAVLQDVASKVKSSVVNVNLALSGELLELTARQRSLRLPGILDQIADQAQ